MSEKISKNNFVDRKIDSRNQERSPEFLRRLEFQKNIANTRRSTRHTILGEVLGWEKHRKRPA